MKHIFLHAELILLIAVSCTTASRNESQVQTNDRYFGIHCDFHATPAPGKIIGATTLEEDIREICRVLRPDFIQIDTKGHPGWASYPTEAGNAMPVIEGDPLALWRKVTKEEGIALYSHYSGVWDSRYIQETPLKAVCAQTEAGVPTLPEQLANMSMKYSSPSLWNLPEITVWTAKKCGNIFHIHHILNIFHIFEAYKDYSS